MVNRVNDWIDLPPSYRSAEQAWGGSDMELDWNTPAATRAWADGYNSADTWRYVNFGDAAGCPPGGGDCGTAFHPSWTSDDVWYISYGVAPAWPIPQIYSTNGVHASQWQQLSLWAYNNRGSRMTILGALTQWQACHDPGRSCDGSLQIPADWGWKPLWDTLESDWRTQQPVLEYSTDITWRNNSSGN
jgi:hypothetical protein